MYYHIYTRIINLAIRGMHIQVRLFDFISFITIWQMNSLTLQIRIFESRFHSSSNLYLAGFGPLDPLNPVIRRKKSGDERRRGAVESWSVFLFPLLKNSNKGSFEKLGKYKKKLPETSRNHFFGCYLYKPSPKLWVAFSYPKLDSKSLNSSHIYTLRLQFHSSKLLLNEILKV